MNMLAEIKQFVKDRQEDIVLFLGVVLVSLFSFALGFIVAKYQEKEPLKIEKINTSIVEVCSLWSKGPL